MPWWTCPKCKTQYCYSVNDNPTCSCLKVPEIKEDKVVSRLKEAEEKKKEDKARKPMFYSKMIDKNGKNPFDDGKEAAGNK